MDNRDSKQIPNDDEQSTEDNPPTRIVVSQNDLNTLAEMLETLSTYSSGKAIAPKKNVTSADAIILDNGFEGVSSLIEGRTRLNPQNFYNLSTIVEAIVLHNKVWTLGDIYKGDSSLTPDSLYAFLSSNGVLHTLGGRAFVSKEDEIGMSIHRLMDKQIIALESIGVGEAKIQRMRFKNGDEGMASWLRSLIDDMEQQISWYWSEDGALTPIVEVMEGADQVLIPVYSDVLMTPFRSWDKQVFSFSRDLYNAMGSRLNSDIKRALKHFGIKQVDIPPLMALLLSRCRTREDLPEQIVKLHAEFSELRERTSQLEVSARNARTLGEKIDVLDELESNKAKLLEKMKLPKKHTRLVYRIWDIVKAGTFFGIGKNIVDSIISHQGEKASTEKFGAYLDIYKSVRQIENEHFVSSIERVFETGMDNELEAAFRNYAQAIEKHLFPNGR